MNREHIFLGRLKDTQCVIELARLRDRLGRYTGREKKRERKGEGERRRERERERIQADEK